MARHLTLEERERVSQMVHAHRSQAEIARRLKRHPSTISRELRRNRSPNGYWAVSAQGKADARRSNRPWTCKMERPEVASYVRQRLRQRWSPDEIAGRSREDFPRDPRRRLSRQTMSDHDESLEVGIAAGLDVATAMVISERDNPKQPPRGPDGRKPLSYAIVIALIAVAAATVVAYLLR